MLEKRPEMKKKLLVIGIVLFGVAALLLVLERTKPIKSVRMTSSKKLKIQPEQKQQKLTEREKMIAEQIAIITDPDKRSAGYETVKKAMERLGELPSPEGIEVLVDYIDYPFSRYDTILPALALMGGGRNTVGVPGESAQFSQLCPAIRALVQIGEPCIDAVIDKLSNGGRGRFPEKTCTIVLLDLSHLPSVREKLQKSLPKVKPGRRYIIERALRALGPEPVPIEK